MQQEDYEDTRHWIQQALTLSETFRHVFGIATNNTVWGKIDLYERNYASAQTHLSKGLQVYWDGGYQWFAPMPLTYIAQMFVDQNETDRAVEILAAIHKYPIWFIGTDKDAQALVDQLKKALEPERFAAAWARGEERELSAVVVELLAELKDE